MGLIASRVMLSPCHLHFLHRHRVVTVSAPSLLVLWKRGDLSGLAGELGTNSFLPSQARWTSREEVFRDIAMATGARAMIVAQARPPHCTSTDRSSKVRRGLVLQMIIPDRALIHLRFAANRPQPGMVIASFEQDRDVASSRRSSQLTSTATRKETAPMMPRPLATLVGGAGEKRDRGRSHSRQEETAVTDKRVSDIFRANPTSPMGGGLWEP